MMFLFYVISFFKTGDTIQGGTLFKGGQYLGKYGKWNFIERLLKMSKKFRKKNQSLGFDIREETLQYKNKLYKSNS